jgi:uncharacterized protein YyaL (SSP411 family)
MPNHLANQSSPYLLQHKDNSVDWYPWGDEAILKARTQDKPIFLSIGYSTCHWCHVMAHESFSNEDIARYLNEHFISIKVDREEKPDIDTIYMTAVVGLTGQGGWPLSVFLTPELKPFFGGTYFPPELRHGIPGFIDVLKSVYLAWSEQHEQVQESSTNLVDYINKQLTLNFSQKNPITLSQLRLAAEKLIKTFDQDHGGWGNAPMFPMPMTLDFLLQQSTRNVALSYEVAARSLEKMSSGGMLDLVGGGFHRYSTDIHWHIPHYEKMLYDNALLARVYLHAYQINKNPIFKAVAQQTIDFIIRDLQSPEGVFYSALDADSPEGEGNYYLWSGQEIRNVIQSPADYEFFGICFPEISDTKQLLTLHKRRSDIELANSLQIPLADFYKKEKSLLSKLFEYRKTRQLPPRDKKIILSWNCLMISTLAETAAAFGSIEYLNRVNASLEFIANNMIIKDRVYRIWNNGTVGESGHLDDYAALVLALLSGYEITSELRWFTLAGKILELMLEGFSDGCGGFVDTSSTKNLVVVPQSIQDNAIPSGNSLAVHALLKYSYFTEQQEPGSKSIHLLESILSKAVQYPLAFSYWLQVMDFSIGLIQQLAIVSADKTDSITIHQEIRSKYLPRLIICSSIFPPDNLAPSLLKGRPIIDDKTTFYLCQNFTCHQPLTDIHRINRLLGK